MHEIDTIEGKWVNSLTNVKVSRHGDILLYTSIVICGKHVAGVGHGRIGRA